MSDFEYAEYTYEPELRDLEKALDVVHKQIEGLRLGKYESHIIAQLWEVMESVEQVLGVEQ